jgi:polysaccharide export outer membrane protein
MTFGIKMKPHQVKYCFKNVILFIGLVLFFTSCRSYKDLTMLRDLREPTDLVPRSVIDYRYKIKVNDNLYVSIVSTNPELDEIYNPATVGISRMGGGGGGNIWSELTTQFVHGYLVDLDGSITLPTIGKVYVLGMTILECEEEIKQKAIQYLKNVTAKVRLLNYKVTVMGEVVNPGVYFNYNTELTVFDAISMASGIKNTAALNNVVVIREFGNKSQTFKLDLNNANSLTSEAYNILPNDVIFVQPSKYKDLELKLPVYSLVLSAVTTFLLVLNYVNGL